MVDHKTRETAVVWATIVSAIAAVIGLGPVLRGDDLGERDAPVVGATTTASPTPAPHPSSTPFLPKPPPLPPTDDPPPPPTDEPATVEPVAILSVDVGPAGDFMRVGPGLYELAGRSMLEVRYNWRTLTNYGIAEGENCAVVATGADASGGVVHVDRSAICTLTGWSTMQVPAGQFTVTVHVRLETGQTGSGRYEFSVVP